MILAPCGHRMMIARGGAGRCCWLPGRVSLFNGFCLVYSDWPFPDALCKMTYHVLTPSPPSCLFIFIINSQREQQGWQHEQEAARSPLNVDEYRGEDANPPPVDRPYWKRPAHGPPTHETFERTKDSQPSVALGKYREMYLDG